MGDKGPSQAVQNQQMQISQEQVALADKQNARSQQLYDLSYPGMEKAEKYYTNLSSGDPTVIFRSIAPAAEQIRSQSEAAKANIDSTMPRGGEARLAKELVDANSAGQIGRTATSSYLGSFDKLAALAGQGIGLSANEVSLALSGLSGGATTSANLGQQQAAGKAAQLGFIGSLVGGGAGVAAAAVCWIAEALFGKHDARTLLVRRWLNDVYDETFIGGIIVFLYRKYGRRLARLVARSETAKAVARPIFNYFLARAGRETMAWRIA